MIKEEYLAIKNDSKSDTMPVLHLFFNTMCKEEHKLAFNDFKVYFSQWLNNPFIALNLGGIIEQAFLKLDEIYEINK